MNFLISIELIPEHILEEMLRIIFFLTDVLVLFISSIKYLYANGFRLLIALQFKAYFLYFTH